ncbi:hypothetical protein ACVXHA_07825 [Escherichia coli]
MTTETDVASLKNHLAGEPLGHETTLAQTRRASGSAVHRAGLVYRQITL